MTRPFRTATATVALAVAALSADTLAARDLSRLSSFPVALNTPEGADAAAETSAEIVSATADGLTLVYTDSPAKALGFIDATDAAAPKPAGRLALDGEPTSVVVVGAKALVALNTSESFTAPSGKLLVVDIAAKAVEASCDLAGQPDAIAAAKDGAFVAIAIENERDEELNDGVIPQLPAGTVQIVTLADGVADCASIVTADLTGLAAVAPEDPEPEFVDVNAAGEIVVTMQENNHLAILGRDGEVIAHFSAGAVDLDGIDATTDGRLSFTEAKAGALREPDTVKWLDEQRFVTANEGDYEGGSRSFTIFGRDGAVLYDSGASLDRIAALHGHYPESRSRRRGVEPEGLAVGSIDGEPRIFVLLERASLVAVYADTGAEPTFLQALPSGVGPEGAVVLDGRGLLVTANEVDLGADGAARSHVMLYGPTDGAPSYPTIRSVEVDGAPIGWGALSGLVADAEKAGTLYAVSDSVYRSEPAIFTIDATKKPAEITGKLVITRDGQPAQKLDLEGVTLDGEGGFWLASEGRTDKLTPHALYHVDAKGRIREEIAFPAELLAGETRFGAEGVAKVGALLWVAMQREWKDDAKGFVKLVAYDTEKKEWAGAVRYPLDAPSEGGWVGLSEITVSGEHAYIVERDNLIGAAAALKKVYRVPLSALTPAAFGTEAPTLTKEPVVDLLPTLTTLTNGYAVDKVEGFAIDAAGEAFVVTDNDGVDDSSGETLFFSLGKL